MKTKSELSRLTILDIKDPKPSKVEAVWPKLGSKKRDKSSIAL